MSSEPATSYPYTRYLVAKRTVDDRALNRRVLDDVRRLVPPGARRVLEIGGGLGTMVGRLLDWDVLAAGEYVLVDADRRLLRDARTWLCEWARARGRAAEPLDDGVRLGELRVRLVEAELGDYLSTDRERPAELLIANAFLDLVDVPAVLPGLLRLLVPGGVYWFTVTFDGESIFQPDHPGDADVLSAYHRSMDERVRYGRPAGESRAGRHLFHHLHALGAAPVSVGASDWVVHARPDGTYPDDEAYFLETILQTIHDELGARAGVAEWIAARRRQLGRGELLYIAHQLDLAGRSPG